MAGIGLGDIGGMIAPTLVQLLFIGKILLILLPIFILIAALFWYQTYRLKYITLTTRGSEDGGYYITGIKTKRYKYTDKTCQQVQPVTLPMMKPKTYTAVPAKYMLAGDICLVAKYGENITPAEVLFKDKRVLINVLPSDLRQIQGVIINQNNSMFAPKDFFKAHMAEIIAGSVFMVALVGLIITGYWMKEMTSPTVTALSENSAAVMQMNQNLQKYLSNPPTSPQVLPTPPPGNTGQPSTAPK